MIESESPRREVPSLVSLCVDVVAKNFRLLSTTRPEEIHSLPHDLKHEIFVKLPEVVRLRDEDVLLLADSAMTEFSSGSSAQPGITDRSLKLAPFQQLQSLRLCGCYISADGLEILFRQNPFLNKVTLSSIDIDNDDLIKVLPLLRNVTHLNLRALKFLDDNVIRVITSELHSIRHLDVRFSRCITNAGVDLIASTYREQLEDLDLSFCRRVTDTSLLQLAKKCPNLRRLYIDANPHIASDSVVEVLVNCVSLIVLSLHDCELIDDDLFNKLPASVQELALEHLDLRGCFNLSPELVQERTHALMPHVRTFAV